MIQKQNDKECLKKITISSLLFEERQFRKRILTSNSNLNTRSLELLVLILPKIGKANNDYQEAMRKRKQIEKITRAGDSKT